MDLLSVDFIPIGLVSKGWRKTTPGAEAESPSSHPLGKNAQME
jgi:hypothetical protein